MSRMMLHGGLLAVIAAVCLLAGYQAGAQEAAPKGTPNSLEPGQVMKVGTTVITAEQLIARLWDAEWMAKPENRDVGNQLTYLQNTALLELEAKRLGGLSFTNEELSAEAKRQMDAMRAQLKADSRGLMTVEEWVKQQGMTMEEFEAYLLARVPVILLKRVLVNYFEQTEQSLEASHILLTKLEDANDIHRRLKATPAKDLEEVFEDLAVTRSAEPGAGVTRGRLPRVYQNDGGLVKVAADALWALKDKEFSEPVKAEYDGQTYYHIFLRRKTLTPVKRTLAEMRADLMNARTRPDEENYFNRWVRWVFNTQKYKVERRLPGYDCKPDQKIEGK